MDPGSEQRQLPAGTMLDEKYRVESLLARGGMGAVYAARDRRLPRLTALKLMHRDLFADHEIRTRFEREADLVAQLDHPNIITVYDFGVDERIGSKWRWAAAPRHDSRTSVARLGARARRSPSAAGWVAIGGASRPGMRRGMVRKAATATATPPSAGTCQRAGF